jgi:hypothetical protein
MAEGGKVDVPSPSDGKTMGKEEKAENTKSSPGKAEKKKKKKRFRYHNLSI